VAITPADVQDRDGFIPLLKAVRRVSVILQRIFADGGYAEPRPPQRQNAQAKSNFVGRRQQRYRYWRDYGGPAGSSRRKLQRLPAYT